MTIITHAVWHTPHFLPVHYVHKHHLFPPHWLTWPGALKFGAKKNKKEALERGKILKGSSPHSPETKHGMKPGMWCVSILHRLANSFNQTTAWLFKKKCPPWRWKGLDPCDAQDLNTKKKPYRLSRHYSGRPCYWWWQGSNCVPNHFIRKPSYVRGEGPTNGGIFYFFWINPGESVCWFGSFP